jgi:hypothetical protein
MSMACFLWTTRFPALLLLFSLFLPSRRGIGGGGGRGKIVFVYMKRNRCNNGRRCAGRDFPMLDHENESTNSLTSCAEGILWLNICVRSRRFASSCARQYTWYYYYEALVHSTRKYSNSVCFYSVTEISQRRWFSLMFRQKWCFRINCLES